MTSLFSTCRTLCKLGRLDGRRRRLLLEAVFWLALIRSALWMMPFRHLARHLGTATPPEDGQKRGSPAAPSAEHVALAADIGWAVTRAARHLPFEAVCLPQAMAAKAMLRRRGVLCAIYFGGAKDAAGMLEAHAWLLAAGIEVTGYPVPGNFVTIACFV